jgi:hypothetical protein
MYYKIALGAGERMFAKYFSNSILNNSPLRRKSIEFRARISIGLLITTS